VADGGTVEHRVSVSTFGEDEAGEIYVADHSSGDIYRWRRRSIRYRRRSGECSQQRIRHFAGSLVRYSGAASPAPGIVKANGFPLPIELEGLRFVVNGAPAPLLSVANTTSGEQVNFQLPFEVAPGEATLRVVRGRVEGRAVQIDVRRASPGIFAEGGVAAAYARITRR